MAPVHELIGQVAHRPGCSIATIYCDLARITEDSDAQNES